MTLNELNNEHFEELTKGELTYIETTCDICGKPMTIHISKDRLCEGCLEELKQTKIKFDDK